MSPRLFRLQGPLSFPLQVIEALASVFSLPTRKAEIRTRY